MNKYLSILLVLFFVWLPLVPAQAPYQINTLVAGSINSAYFPVLCGNNSKPTWCGSGTTLNAWILAACSQIRANGSGGIVDLTGLTGNMGGSTRGCSTVSKRIIFIQNSGVNNLTSNFNITENDGDMPFPLDNNSMFLGFGGGQCNPIQGITVDPSANISAVIGPAHTDATQEDFTVDGVCIYGNQAATVTKGLVYSESNFANTTISNNNISECPTACIHIINSSTLQLFNNWLNVTDGSTSPGRALWIQSIVSSGGAPSSTGCRAGNIHVQDGQVEHAYGGVSDIDITGDGAGAIVCGVRIDNVGVERNNVLGSTIAINLSDCLNCSVNHSIDSGTNGGTDFIKISQTATGRTQNAEITNLNPGGTYTNVIDDTTPGGQVWTVAAHPQVDKYVSGGATSGESLYSAALNPLPTCSVNLLAQKYIVIDATSPTYFGTYTSGGGLTAPVICQFNGSSYSWVTY